MLRVLPLLLLFVMSFAAAASLDERANAAFARVALRPEQQAPYDEIIRTYYQRMSEMAKHASWGASSNEQLQRLVKNRGTKISDETVVKMSKVLDEKQLEEFRYAIDLANRSFYESIPTE